MGDGVQFLFELDAKAPGMDKLLQQLGQSNAKLKESHGHLKHTEEGFKGVGKSVEEVSKKLSEFGEFLGIALVFEGVEKLTEGFMDLGKEILHTAAQAESLSFSLDVNFGKGGKEIEEWADRLAKQTPFTGQQLKGWAIELGHAGVAMKDLDKYMFAGLDVAARSSDKAGAMATAIEAMRRVEMTGKIGGRQLMGLGLPAENLQILPQFKGLKKADVLKKLETAELSKHDLFMALTGGAPIGEVGADMQGLLGTKMKNLSTLPEQYFEQATKSTAFEPFKARLDDLFKELDPAGEKGQQILASFGQMLMSIVDGLQKIDFKEVADDFSKFVGAIEKLVPIIVQITGSIGATVSDAAGVVGTVRTVGKKVIPSPLSSEREDAALEIQRRAGALPSQSKIGATLGRYIPFYNTLQDSFFNPTTWKLAFSDATAGGVKGLQAGAPALEAAGAKAGAAAVKGASGPEGIDAHSPSKKFEQLGVFANLGFARGMRGTTGAVAGAIRDVMSIPTRRAGGVPAGAGGGVSMSFHGTQVHVANGGREEGVAAAEGFFASIEARVLALLERKRNEEGT